MTQYNGMYEYILKLQDAYDTPTPTIYEPKKEKWVLVPKFPPVTPKHNRTTKSFEDTKRILRELDNDPIYQLIETHQFVQHQEQGGPVLTKKLAPPKHNRTTKSFEDTKRILRELDNDPICQLTETHQFVQHQEQGGPVLTKKLTPPKNTGNK